MPNHVACKEKPGCLCFLTPHLSTSASGERGFHLLPSLLCPCYLSDDTCWGLTDVSEWMHACVKGEIFKTRTLGVKTTSVTYYQPPWNDPLWRKITKLKDTECILLQDTTVNITGCNSDTPTVPLCPRPLFQSRTYHLDLSSVTQCHH